MEFEEYIPHGPRVNEQPLVTINRRGEMKFNSAAKDQYRTAFTHAKYARLFWSSRAKVIGIRLQSEAEKSANSVNFLNKNDVEIVKIGFFRAFPGLDAALKETRSYPLTRQPDGLFLVDLSSLFDGAAKADTEADVCRRHLDRIAAGEPYAMINVKVEPPAPPVMTPRDVGRATANLEGLAAGNRVPASPVSTTPTLKPGDPCPTCMQPLKKGAGGRGTRCYSCVPTWQMRQAQVSPVDVYEQHKAVDTRPTEPVPTSRNGSRGRQSAGTGYTVVKAADVDGEPHISGPDVPDDPEDEVVPPLALARLTTPLPDDGAFSVREVEDGWQIVDQNGVDVGDPFDDEATADAVCEAMNAPESTEEPGAADPCPKSRRLPTFAAERFKVIQGAATFCPSCKRTQPTYWDINSLMESRCKVCHRVLERITQTEFRKRVAVTVEAI